MLEFPESLPLTKKDPLKAKPEEPARMIAIWSDAIYTEAGKPPIRGFGGRLYFYNRDNNAIPVDGQLVVYGYDDSIEGSPARAARSPVRLHGGPVRQAFHARPVGRVVQHLDTVGAGRRLQKDGDLVAGLHVGRRHRVQGQQTVNLLPGKTPAARTADPPPDASGLREAGVVQPASYQQPAAPERR